MLCELLHCCLLLLSVLFLVLMLLLLLLLLLFCYCYPFCHLLREINDIIMTLTSITVVFPELCQWRNGNIFRNDRLDQEVFK